MRNTFKVYFRQYLGQADILDEYGQKTGSFAPQYGKLVKIRLSVSPNKGSAEAEMFGTMEDYDRTATTADTKCPINENSILWLDGADPNGAHNYIVKKVAPWKNSISYALKKVDLTDV